MNIRQSLSAALFLLIATIALLLPRASAMSPMVGGYTTIPTDDDGAVQAGNFAVNKIYESNVVSHRIVSAARQVVAGLNYQLTIHTNLRDPAHGCKSDTFVVYNRFGDLSVTSRTENPGGCE